MGASETSLIYAFEGFEKDLSEELSFLGAQVEHQDGRLFLAHKLSRRPVWAQVFGAGAQTHSFASISEAAKTLKTQKSTWFPLSQKHHRRSELIQDRCFPLRPQKQLEFLKPPRFWNWGAWALLGENQLVMAPETDVLLPFGAADFLESQVPPSRAYLKLWELFTLYLAPPTPGTRVLELGGSPGGWTWVLAEQLKCPVLAVDRAPLAPAVAKHRLVRSLQGDAFKVGPDVSGPVDWLFSDLICYPEKLYDLVAEWRERGVQNFVCSLKFQGSSDFKAMEKFLQIPGSRIVHLNANKHEVTWFVCEKP